MALWLTQPLAEMSTSNFPKGKGRPACKADNLTTIYEPIAKKMWELLHLTTLYTSTGLLLIIIIVENGILPDNSDITVRHNTEI
jgi:hypothetical protein